MDPPGGSHDPRSRRRCAEARSWLTPLLSPVVLLSVVGACSKNNTVGPEQAAATYQGCIEDQTTSLRATVPPEAEPPKGPFSANLVAADPTQMADLIRASVKTAMLRSVNESRINYLAMTHCDDLKPRPNPGFQGSQDAGAAFAPPSAASADNGGGASQVSTTNNQVANVDEADFVKNDNKYIYVVNGQSFRIIEAWPAAAAHEIANVTVTGEAKKLFVEGDRAVVYSSTPSTKSSGTYGGNGYGYYGASGECTYGSNGCVPASDGTETEMSIYDISNRAIPVLVRSIHSSSSLISARRIGNAVHTVLGEPQTIATSWQSAPNLPSSGYDDAKVNAAFDALIARNTAAIDKIGVSDVLPQWRDSTGPAPEQTLYQSSMPDGATLTSVLSFDLTSNATPKIASVVGRPGWTYASADALYLAVPHEQISGWGWYEGQSAPELSTIHKFSIGTSPNETAYIGTGVVKGRVLNQFAMDEKDGFLRVATTTGHLPDPEAHNTVSIFEDHAGKLDVVGEIDHIAPGEDIRSVRFDGERGFIVTFKKTDPLFVFDLADPHAPKTMGELKIPGFSTYMHLMDATHLLTIGYDAADQGDFAFFTGMILQIFDVTDPSNPTLAHKEVIGTRGSSSEAATNHLAFNYFAPKNVLALPMTICQGGDTNGNYGTDMTFSGLIVYDTTVADGFKLRGKVAHPNSSQGGDDANASGYYDSGCYNWWSNASSEVKRSIFMDDYVFSISTSRIKVNQLDNLGTDVKELSLK